MDEVGIGVDRGLEYMMIGRSGDVVELFGAGVLSVVPVAH